MKKRLFACLLAACLAVSVLVLPASAASLNNSAIQTAITLGAMDTSQTGSLDAAVTRGAFAKMLVSFSAYRESASQQGNLGTLYKDVPGSSQWAPYVRIAVQQGWMNGYTDGTFRPDNTVTLEEACTAALKLLGYKMTDLNGVFPTAQLNKAQELGLRNQLNRSQSEAMNYEDCALLLYNTLTANTASGSAYGTSLGFTVSNGQVDTSTVMLKSLKVILCERGIRTFEKYTRNTLDLSAVPIIHEKTHLPIIVDPSHATGKANLVEPMMIAAVAAGADGLEVEVHYDPQHAWSDGAQCLTPDSFAQAMAKCRQVAWAIGRDM